MYQQQIDNKILAIDEEMAGKSYGRNSGSKGKQCETLSAEILATHPFVEKVETELFFEDVDEFSFIDIVVTLKNGELFYVPHAMDLWKGTAQIDRLQTVWTKYKFGAFDNINYTYLYSDESIFQDLMNYEPKRKSVRKNMKVKEVVTTLKSNGVLGNIDDIMNAIDKIAEFPL